MPTGTTEAPIKTDEQRFQEGVNEALRSAGIEISNSSATTDNAPQAISGGKTEQTTETPAETPPASSPDAPTETSPKTPAETPPTSPAESAPTDKHEEHPDNEKTPASPDGSPAPSSEAKPDHGKTGGKQLFKPDDSREDLIHRLKTTDGMYRASNEKVRMLEKELVEMKAKQAQPPAAAPAAPTSTPSPTTAPAEDQDKALEQAIASFPAFKQLNESYGDTMPEIPAAMMEMSKNMFHALSGSFDARIRQIQASMVPMQEDYRRVADEQHFHAIQQAHPDVIVKENGKWQRTALANELDTWLETLPEYKKLAYQKVRDEGTADEIIDLFNDFKAATGYSVGTEPPPTPPATPEAQKPPPKVRTRNTPVTPEPRVKTDEERYQDGVKEAMAQL
jgi:hypothetical protein